MNVAEKIKKAIQINIYVLFGLLLLYPAGIIISKQFQCEFELFSVTVYQVFLLVLALSTDVLCFISKEKYGLHITVLSLITVFLAIVNVLALSIHDSNPYLFFMAGLTVVACFVFAMRYAKKIIVRILSIIVYLPFYAYIYYVCFFFNIFGGMSNYDTIYSVKSPNGQYYADVIGNSQGALGGSTLVKVRDDKLNLLLFSVKKTEKIYSGKWHEQETIDVQWKDDNCLLINGVEYVVEW